MSRPDSKPTITDSNLIIGDRLNFPYLIGNALLEYIKNRNKSDLEFSPEQIKQSAIAVSRLIPVAWEDEQYAEDCKKAIDIVKTDDSDYWCGVRMVPYKWKLVKRVNPDVLVQAIMGLLNRRKMLARSIPQELMDRKEG